MGGIEFGVLVGHQSLKHTNAPLRIAWLPRGRFPSGLLGEQTAWKHPEPVVRVVHQNGLGIHA
jgi:hypothetical protein